MHRLALAACLVATLCLGGVRAYADATITPQAALARLFSSAHADPDWFTASFLQQVPAASVEAITRQLTSQLGAFKSIKPEGSKYRVLFDHGDDLASIVLDSSGRITGLFFESPQPYAASFESAIDAFKSLSGHVSVYVTHNGAAQATLSSDVPLAVGSSFKLAVLNALAEEVSAGAKSWRSVVTLEARHKSLPSGMLQTWPDSAPLTAYTYAALMISQSDNTAADTMLLFAGRENVERFGPRNRPFLTTREAFILKDPNNAALLARYRAGDEAVRRELLEQVDALSLPDPSIFSADPLDTDIEWFFTTRELCGLMAGVEQLPLMSINPGVAEPADWARVAYKGGSEPGVLNLTTWLLSRSGSAYCVSATWNDTKALDELKFFGLYKSLLSTLKT